MRRSSALKNVAPSLLADSEWRLYAWAWSKVRRRCAVGTQPAPPRRVGNCRQDGDTAPPRRSATHSACLSASMARGVWVDPWLIFHNLTVLSAGGRCQVSGVRWQVAGVRCQVSGVKCQVSSVRCQVSGVKCQVSGVRWQVEG